MGSPKCQHRQVFSLEWFSFSIGKRFLGVGGRRNKELLGYQSGTGFPGVSPGRQQDLQRIGGGGQGAIGRTAKGSCSAREVTKQQRAAAPRTL